MYLAILDFEATCWKDSDEHEIIEFPTVIVNVEKRTIIDQFRVFVKPRNNPVLSDFCKELTGITQEEVDKGLTLEEAINEHMNFINLYNPIYLVTCGDWDLKIMLPMDVKDKELKDRKIYHKWINIKIPFCEILGIKKRMSMPGMLEKLKLELIGRHHSGLDDSRNIARIAIALLERGWIPKLTGTLV